MQYIVTNSYTTAYTPIVVNLDANYIVTNCTVASEKEIVNEHTSLTYGKYGFVYLGGKLSLAKVNGTPARFDINGDSYVTFYDAMVTLKAILNKKGIANSFIADMDGNDYVGIVDVLAIIKNLTL